MVYISGGQVQDSRSPWRISIVSDLFWGFINFVVLFFQTMFSPSMTKHGNNYTTDYKAGNDGGGGGGPRRRMGGFRRGGAPAPPPAAGGG